MQFRGTGAGRQGKCSWPCARSFGEFLQKPLPLQGETCVLNSVTFRNESVIFNVFSVWFAAEVQEASDGDSDHESHLEAVTSDIVDVAMKFNNASGFAGVSVSPGATASSGFVPDGHGLGIVAQQL